MSEDDLLKLQCLVGNYLNGFKIVSVEKDPFIKGQINLFTDETKEIGSGDKSIIKFYVRNKSSATLHPQQENKELFKELFKEILNKTTVNITLKRDRNRRDLEMKEKIEERIKKAEEELKEARKELKNYKESKYSVVEFGGYEWYVVAEDNDTKTLFMKDKLSENDIKGIFNKEYLDDDKDVRFSFHDNKWRDSIIRAVLNTEFLIDLDRSKLRPMTTNLNGIETVDYVRLISKEEVEKFPVEIRKCSGEYGYWTLTPYSNDAYFVNRVWSNGYVNNNHAHYENGVRPVIRVLSSEIVSV